MGQTTGTTAKARQLVVGVADLGVSQDPGTVIVTFAIGSCIGVTLFDPVAQIGGVLHYMLPQPGNGASAEERPCRFATTGLPLLFSAVAKAGGRKERLVVCAAGGSAMMNDGGLLAIGERNRTVLRRILGKNDIALAAEDTGGDRTRHLSLDVGTGEVRTRSAGEEVTLWSP